MIQAPIALRNRAFARAKSIMSAQRGVKPTALKTKPFPPESYQTIPALTEDEPSR